MKKILILLIGFSLNVDAQLKGQVITLEAISTKSTDSDLVFLGKLDSVKSTTTSKIRNFGLEVIPFDALTNIAVNTITRIIKKRIERKNVDYSNSISGENFYLIKKDSVYQGIKALNLKRNKNDKTELDLKIIPVFSKDKQFFKWQITNCDVAKGAFRKKSKNVDIEVKIDFSYQYITTNLTLVTIPEQLIKIYAAQNKTMQLKESDWMAIPKLSAFNGESYNPVYNLKLNIKEVTSIPEIYTEIVKEEDALKESLTELIKNLTKSIPKK